MPHIISIESKITIDNTEYDGEIGKITDTLLGYEEHGILTIKLKFGFQGSSQAAGGYSLSGVYLSSWVEKILEVLNVQSWEEVKGQEVYAIRFNKYQQITGLCSLDGTRFMIFSEVLSKEK